MDNINDKSVSNKEWKEEISLRPTSLDDYVGQKELKNNLRIFIGAALHRNETLDHCLFYGPPGLGKTSLAYVISNEMHGQIRVITGPSIEKPGDLVTILADLQPGEILFIDEIHRLPRIVEEILYQAMEDFSISIVVNKDTAAKTLTVDLNPFTLIGATTRAGDLSSPLRDRFGICNKINFYTIDEIEQIIHRTASVFSCEIDNKGAKEIAKRSRGTPRIANRLFKRVRDFANYEGCDNITYLHAKTALNALKVDNLGLDEVDLKYLNTIIDHYNGGPVGLDAIASAIGEEPSNLEDVYEPYLIQIGFLNRTSKGRVVTEKAYKHLKRLHQGSLK